jgi:hypothetical protein
VATSSAAARATTSSRASPATTRSTAARATTGWRASRDPPARPPRARTPTSAAAAWTASPTRRAAIRSRSAWTAWPTTARREGDNVDPSILTVHGGGTDDTITGSSGRNILAGLGGNDRILGLGGDDQLEGGLGNDELAGAEGQDILGGGDGDDALDGGPGVDRFWGDELTACISGLCASGQDRILARDGAAEAINCGPGTDTAVVDAIDEVHSSVGPSDRCETVDRAGAPAAGTPGAPAPGAGPTAGALLRATVARVSLDRRGRFVVRLSAPAAGIVTVRASTRVSQRGRRRTVSLGRASTIARRAGAMTLRLTPSRASRAAIRRLRRIRVTVRVTFRPASGAAAGTSRAR